MRVSLIIILFSIFLLAGCDLQQVIDAASGINQKADQATTAISEEVHSIRAIEITHNGETFTVNDIYKSILRDVTWHYETIDEAHNLTISGTWQPNLLQQYDLTLKRYSELDVTGKVNIQLVVDEGIIQEEETIVQVVYEGDTLVDEKGQSILHALYDDYTMR